MLLKYFGEDRVNIRAPFSGGIIAAGQHAAIVLAGSRFRGSVTAHDVFLRPGTIFEYRPISTKQLSSTSLSGVGIVGEDPNPESSQQAPVEVVADNPFFQGSFDDLGRITATSEGEYSHTYDWAYTRDAQFDIRAFSGDSATEALSHGWGGLPAIGAAPSVQASWHMRGGLFIPGNIYTMDAYLTSFDSQFRLTTQNAATLWATLSPDVTVIPVVAVAWYRSDQGTDGGAAGAEIATRYIRQLSALLDFTRVVLPPVRTAPTPAESAGTRV